MKNFTFKQLLLIFILATIFLLSVFNVVYLTKAGIADAHTLAVRDQLATLRSNGTIPDPIAWATIHQELTAASQLMPDSPQYYEDIAYLYAVRGVNLLKFPEIANPNLENALQNYQAALRTRPMAPATWANMALASYYLRKDNETTLRLFDVANLYGPNDPGAQIPLFFLAMQNWDRMSDEQKKQLKSVYKNARNPLKKDLTTIVRQFHLQDFS